MDSPDIKTEPAIGKDRVVKLDEPLEFKVHSYGFNRLNKVQKEGSLIKSAAYGDLAAKIQKSTKFQLNPLLRENLQVENEEKRRIDERVNEKFALLAEQTKKDAEAAGYQEGLKRGHEEAFKKFQKDADDRIQKLTTLIEELESQKAKITEANEKIFLEIIYKIARAVLLKELSADKEYILRLVKELSSTLELKEYIRISVHPRDMESIAQIREELKKSFENLKNIHIVASESVKSGGCMVETELMAIDARVDTQLQKIYESVL